MTYRYLTRSYVEWLGLERVPILKPRSPGCCIGGDTLPPPTSWPEGVIHAGSTYEREPDGLAYTRLPPRDWFLSLEAS